MGKIQQKRLKQSEHDHESWMSGFMNLFDFRRGGSNQRLISNKRFGSKVRGERFSQDVSQRIHSSEYQFEYNAYESREAMLGPRKESVKNLIDEDMVNEGSRKHNLNDSFLGFVDFANDEDINNLVREILVRIQKKGSGEVEHEHKDNFYTWPPVVRAKFVEQLTDATKILLHEKLIGRVHVGFNGKIQYSREFIDALVTLIYHKELLFKLLEDPNSELTKRVNNLVNSELQRSADQKESEVLHHDNKSLFSTRSNILFEPVPEALSTSTSFSSSGSGLRRKSSFTFTEIKRMLKRAMGKDKEEVYVKNGLGRSMSRRDSFGRMSPITNPHLEVEIHPRRLSNPEWSDVESMEKPNTPFMNEIEKKITSSYVEPKTTSNHMLANENTHEKFFKWRDLESTRKSLSMPDRNRSPSSHPTRQSSMPSAHRRSTSQVLEQENNLNVSLCRSDNSLVVKFCEPDEKWSNQFESLYPSPLLSENIVYSDGEYEGKFSFVSSAAMTNADYDEQDVIDIDYTAPSPAISTYSDFVSDKTDKFDDVTSKIDTRPSPMSVLEPECVENEGSPPSTKNLQCEFQVAPFKIQFEEGEEEDISEFDSEKSPFMKKYCDDHESKLNYMKKILITSGFSWDTLYIRYLSSNQLLELSLDDAEVDTKPDQNMLLLDLLNNVLEDACARYFGCSPWVSLSKSNIRPVSDTENTFEEILEEVDSLLHSSSHPQDVEDIVTKELYQDVRYTNFQSDFEIIGTEIADLILQKLLTETALSCFSYADRPRLIHAA